MDTLLNCLFQRSALRMRIMPQAWVAKKNGHFHGNVSFRRYYLLDRKPSVGVVLFYRPEIRRYFRLACRLCNSSGRVLQKKCNKSGSTKAGQNVFLGDSGATGNNNAPVAVRLGETWRLIVGRCRVFTRQRLCLSRIFPMTHESTRVCFILGRVEKELTQRPSFDQSSVSSTGALQTFLLQLTVDLHVGSTDFQ